MDRVIAHHRVSLSRFLKFGMGLFQRGASATFLVWSSTVARRVVTTLKTLETPLP